MIVGRGWLLGGGREMKMGMAVVMVSGRQATAHTRWGQANFREKVTRVDLRSLSSTASPIERNFQLSPWR